MIADIGPLPAGWRLARVDAVAEVAARIGWKALTASEYVDEGFPLLSTANLHTREIDFEDVNYISEFRYNESPDLKLRVGDVLLAKDGTLGVTNLVRELPRPATVSGSIARLRPRMIEPLYLRYVLESGLVQTRIDMLQNGAGVPHLFQWDIKRLPVPLPPPAEQRAIACFLDDTTASLTELIELKGRAIELIEHWWTAQCWNLTHGVGQNWPRAQLRRVADLQAGAAFPHESQGDEDGTIPYVKVSDLARTDEHGYLSDVTNKVTAENARSLRSPVLPAGTIVAPKIGAALLNNRRAILSKRSCLDQNVLGITAKDALNSEYIYFALTPLDLGAFSTPGPVPLLNESVAKAIEIPWPPSNERARVVSELRRMRQTSRELLSTLRKQVTLLRARERSVITAAVTGRLEVA